MNTQVNNHKRFFIHTLGCKVNQYESQAMRELLLNAGFKECLTKDIADIYILNTCSVTGRADRESRYWIGFFHKTNPQARIVVTGCYTERNADDISFLPGVSCILKNNDKGKIAAMLDPEVKERIPLTPFLKITDFKDHTKAFIKIQDGCENSCSYCKVPLVRGSIRSKPIKNILDEVNSLSEKGFKEIVLTGICLGAWGKDLFPEAISRAVVGLEGASLADVLKALETVKGDFRIRLSSIEPRYVTDGLIDYMSKNKRICKHMHIPFQSGDDEILKKMNRPYTVADYKSLVNRARDKVKDIAITTDILIGFPGESEANFRNTMHFIKEIIPSRTHIFTFSKREGTAAFNIGEAVDIKTVKRRYHELKAVTLSASYLYRSKFLNERLDVLVETKRDRQTGLLTGYSDSYIKVIFEGPDELMRKIVPVKISDLNLTFTIGNYDKGA